MFSLNYLYRHWRLQRRSKERLSESHESLARRGVAHSQRAQRFGAQIQGARSNGRRVEGEQHGKVLARWCGV